MNKIFRYELKRLLLNKFFIGILAVTLIYGWQVLTGEIVKGISHTAPFSAWSYGSYLARVCPLICLGELFFLTFYTSAHERRVSAITSATPANRRKYALVRSGAVLVGTCILVLFVAIEGVAFYVRLFGWQGYGNLILPTLFALVPPIAFFLGFGFILGRLKPMLTYVAMVVPFLLCYAQIPAALDLIANLFFAAYPLQLGALDPAFSAPASVWIGRICFACAGAIALMVATGRSGAKTTN